MDFTLNERETFWRDRVRDFMEQHVYPRQADYYAEQASGDRWKVLQVVEEAKALKRLSETLSLTHLQVAEMVGKSRASVTNLLRILSLNMDVQAFLETGKIELGHAKALLALKGIIQSQVANTVADRGLSVRETEKIIARIQEQENSEFEKKSAAVDPNIRRLQDDLSDKLGAPVTIRHSNKGQGTLMIRYSHVDELEGILAHFK